MCKTYPQKWGQNVDNVDKIKYEHIFCAICLVYHKKEQQPAGVQ